MPNRMPCHITDGPDEEDALLEELDFEPSYEDIRQQRIDDAYYDLREIEAERIGHLPGLLRPQAD